MELPKPPSPKSEALKPLLWFIAVSYGSASVSAFAANAWAVYWLLGMGTLGSVVFLWAYVYLLLKDPNRLQTEDYMVRVLGSEGTSTVIDVLASKPISNSHMQITQGSSFSPSEEVAK